MNRYQQLFWPVLKRMEAETAHERMLAVLAWAQRFGPGWWALGVIGGKRPSSPRSLFGLTFPNALGIAAGFDKDARVAAGLARLGFGHVEVGTLTPRPQSGNPKPRIFRLAENGALINQMGFPNGGVKAALPRLRKLAQLNARNFVLGISLGKQKETPLVEAARDYLAVMTAVYPYADYLAVNISSPNTPGLRELQGVNYLDGLLKRLQAKNSRLADHYSLSKRPLLVKISPDLTRNELDHILTAVLDNQVDGIIATNTTISRDGLTGSRQNEAGGLSGQPLRQRSTEMIRTISRLTNGRYPIIGVGGVRTATDVQEKLDAGAALVQLYTALVYEGPGLAGRLLRELA